MQIKFLKTVATMNGVYEKDKVYDTKGVPNYRQMIEAKQCKLLTPKGASQ